MGGVRPHFSPTYHVPSGTSRAKSEVVFSDLFRRKLRDGRSRKDRAERGRHHAKGTRYVGELFGRPVGSISCHSVRMVTNSSPSPKLHSLVAKLKGCQHYKSSFKNSQTWFLILPLSSDTSMESEEAFRASCCVPRLRALPHRLDQIKE